MDKQDKSTNVIPLFSSKLKGGRPKGSIKPQTRSNAERQAEFRAKRKMNEEYETDRRLDCWLSPDAWYELERIAKHRGVSKKKIIEQLLHWEDKCIGDHMTDEEYEKYLGPENQ